MPALAKSKEAIVGHTVNLQGADGAGGKIGELHALEASLTKKCWAQKQKYDEKFHAAFEGARNKQENFKNRVLSEHEKNKTELLDLASLEQKAKSIFGPPPIPASSIQTISKHAVLAAEHDPILGKVVIGKQDVDIAKLIIALGSSDWVRAGRQYFGEDAICPFCQRQTPEAFSESLEEFFDESYAADTAAIGALATTYAEALSQVEQRLQAIIALPSPFLNLEQLKAEVALVSVRGRANQDRIEAKRKEPSRVVTLDSLDPVLSTIEGILGEANKAVDAHNALVANFAAEKKLLINQVWRYLLDVELKSGLEEYDSRKRILTKTIEGIKTSIAKDTERRNELETEIKQLQKGITSVLPTINAINSLLTSFGFHNFSLAEATTQGHYRLVRQNGDPVKETLSEGERTFITFLYFYHLLKGSDTENAISVDRVVVFDDPVSSLDSDILFIVSTLIKLLFEEVRNKVSHVKQVFVLTHNVYFHKEVAFNMRRGDTAMKEETFWIIRKDGVTSSIEAQVTDPISTYYEMLWAEVRNPNRSPLTIQNTLRRILENYFRILGKVDPDVICTKFEGRDRVICKSLFSWVNDGSHSAHDDLYISTHESQVATYLTVFKRIFEQENHGAHYRMMMREGDTGRAKTVGAGQPMPQL
jgi:wobble nucleotide-excising tRNase